MKYIKGYNAIRAIAIVMVVLTHLGVNDWLKMSFGFNRLLILITGRTGVTIFFALSGFLITSILLTEKKRTGTIRIKRFYFKRLLRLSPPLLLFFTATAILMLRHIIYPALEGFLFSVSYLYNFVPREYYTPELSHTWSLAIEEQFYLVWPLILTCVANYKNLLLIVLLTIVVCVAGQFTFDQIILHENEKQIFSFGLYYTDRWFIPAVAPIMIGCGAAILTFYYSKQIIALFRNNYLALIISTILYCLPVLVPRTLFSFYFPFYFPLFALSSSIFLVWVFANQHSLLVSLMEWKPIHYLGKISYGIYVYQGLFLTNGPDSQLTFQQYPQNLILTIVIAILSYELIEKKILLYSNRTTVQSNSVA